MIVRVREGESEREGGETEGDADSDVHVEHAVVASLSGA